MVESAHGNTSGPLAPMRVAGLRHWINYGQLPLLAKEVVMSDDPTSASGTHIPYAQGPGPPSTGLSLPSVSGAGAAKQVLGPTSPLSSGDDKIEWFRNALKPDMERWVFSRIMRLLSSDPFAAFILMACAIDYLAGYWCGGKTVEDDYKRFINEFFPKNSDGTERYFADKLYQSLRNGLIHNMALLGAAYTLTDKRPSLHLAPGPSGSRNLNAESFFDDLLRARDSYFEMVEKDPDLLLKATRRHNLHGFMRIVDI